MAESSLDRLSIYLYACLCVRAWVCESVCVCMYERVRMRAYVSSPYVSVCASLRVCG